jgi:hypothetical protein
MTAHELPWIDGPGGTYNFDDEPCTFAEWCALHIYIDKLRVAFTEVGDVEVSTVWLGVWLHNDDRTPLLYETLVFGGALDGQGDRYPNRVAALAGHDQWVAKVKEVNPDD